MKRIIIEVTEPESISGTNIEDLNLIRDTIEEMLTERFASRPDLDILIYVE